MTGLEFARALSVKGLLAHPTDQHGFVYYGPELGQTLAGFYVKKHYRSEFRWQTSVDVSVWVPLEVIGPSTVGDLVRHFDGIGRNLV